MILVGQFRAAEIKETLQAKFWKCSRMFLVLKLSKRIGAMQKRRKGTEQHPCVLERIQL